MPKNQTAWNPDNKGIKETFTQTSRKEVGRQAAQQAEKTLGKAEDRAGRADREVLQEGKAAD